MMPSSAELTRIRADMEAAAMPDTCNILSVTYTSDSQGGQTEAWGTALADVSCRLDVYSGRIGIVGEEMVRSASLKPFSTWVLTVPYGTAITTANRVEVNDITFTITEVDAGRSWGANTRATLGKL